MKRIADEYNARLESGQNTLDELEVHPRKRHKIDVYQQLRVNWEHFANYVWNISKKRG